MGGGGEEPDSSLREAGEGLLEQVPQAEEQHMEKLGGMEKVKCLR